MRMTHEAAMAANPSPSPPQPQSQQTVSTPSGENSDPLPVNSNHGMFPSELHSLADHMLADNYFQMNQPGMSFPYNSMQQHLSAINPNDPVMEIPADSPPSTQSSPDIKMELLHADGGQRSGSGLVFDTQFNMDVARAHEFSANHHESSGSRFNFSARTLQAALSMEDNVMHSQFKPQSFTRHPPQVNNGMGGMSNFESINQSLNQLDQLRPYIAQAAYNVYMPTAVRQNDPNQRFYGPIRPSMAHSEPLVAKRAGSSLSFPDHRGYLTASPTHSSSPASEGSRARVPYHRLTPTQNFKPFDPSPTGNSVKLKRYFCEDCGKGFTQKGQWCMRATSHLIYPNQLIVL